MRPDRVPTLATDAQGRRIINPRKLDIQSYFLAPDDGGFSANGLVTVPAGGNAGPVIFTVDQYGPFEAYYLTMDRAIVAPMLVDIDDEGNKRHLMNAPCHIDTVFGRNTNDALGRVGIGPLMLPETLWMHSSRALRMNFLGTPADTIYPTIHGVRYYGYSNPSEQLAAEMEKRSARGRVSTPFFLTTDQAVLIAGGAGTAAQAFLTVSAEAHFEWFKLAIISTAAFRYRLFDRNGRSYSSNWVHSNPAGGAAAFPFILCEPTIFQANTQLRLDLVNLGGAGNAIFFTMIGRRIYVS
jgi:hypothetical protein